MKKFILELLNVTHEVTARLLSAEKLSTTFIPELQNKWGSPILQENVLKNVKQSAISNHPLQCNCVVNFDDFNNLAMDSSKLKLLLRAIKLFPLELFDWNDSLISSITWLSDFLLIYSTLIVCIDRARICFKMLRSEENKMQFWKCSCRNEQKIKLK